MTSIGGLSSYQRPTQSPRDRLETELQSQIKAGTIATGDEDALSAALDSIDATLSSEGKAARGSGTPPSPEEMQEKISSLIQSQVEAGTLTEDQAAELESVFADAFSGGPGGAGGPGGPGGAGGPPPGPPPSGEEEDEDDTTTSATSTADTLAAVLKQLQDALKAGGDYGQTGTTTSTSQAGLLFDLSA